MNTIFRNAILAGIGAAVLTKEKLDSTMARFVDQGRISEKDARALAARIAEQGRKEFIAASTQAGEALKELLAEADRRAAKRIDKAVSRVRKLKRRPASRRPRARRR